SLRPPRRAHHDGGAHGRHRVGRVRGRVGRRARRGLPAAHRAEGAARGAGHRRGRSRHPHEARPPRAGGRFARLTTTVYTDGACLGNPGPGGWAWAIPGGAHASGADPQTTNQRMEIRAALEAVEANPGPLEVVSDSKYVVDCFNNRWFAKWETNGW